MKFNTKSLHQALVALGEILSKRGLQFEIVAVGGGALLLLGLITRPTKDLDLIAMVDKGSFISARSLPKPLLQAINEVGIAFELDKNWINSGPTDLFSMGLPQGFMTRMETQNFGGLILHLASRFDQICFKLYAAVDQGPQSKHFEDLKLLHPSQDELKVAAKWCSSHDVSKVFATHLSEAINALKK